MLVLISSFALINITQKCIPSAITRTCLVKAFTAVIPVSSASANLLEPRITIHFKGLKPRRLKNIGDADVHRYINSAQHEALKIPALILVDWL